MKIDLLYEIQMPEPWDGPDAEYKKVWETIEQIELADRMGFDTVWFVEHHFLKGFSHSSAPEVVLGNLAARTKDIRLGHGVTLLPWHFNHPIRIAERIATLDILSNGRVEWGTGRSSPAENEGFGMNNEESRARWQEALKIIPRMWQEDPFSYEGHYFKIPERSIIPKPLQKPHPPIWVASTSPESWELAGKNGIGVLGMTLLTGIEELQARMKIYHKALETCEPVGAFINNAIGVFTIVNCSDTVEKAYESGAGDAAMYYIDYASKGFAKLEEMGATQERAYFDIQKKFPLIKKIARGELTIQELDAQDMVIIGDPDHCIEKIEAYERAGFQRLLCLMQVGRLSDEAIKRSLTLFGEHVIPYFKAKTKAEAKANVST
ncbi:MAG: LLM class flavin-dependent oxidoreductase [Chloroflexi bacterium]|nr:LLM class flavin-dependent oxidoreductase [Chloroflexota bacterium]